MPAPRKPHLLFSSARSTKLGIGTTTPNWLLQVAGTRPSLALSDTAGGTNLKHWLFSSMGGDLYIGTSTDTYATSSPAALTITNSGQVMLGTPVSLTGSYAKAQLTAITSRSDVRIGYMDASGNDYGIYTSKGYNASGGSTAIHARTTHSDAVAISAYSGNIGSANLVQLTQNDSAFTGNTIFANMANGGGTFSGKFLNFQVNSVPKFTVDFAGNASSTQLTTTGTTYLATTGGNVGIGTTTPYARLSVVDTTASLHDMFAISSSTSDFIFKVDSYGATYADGAYTGTGADYAEYFYTNSVGLKSGEVVCVDVLNNNAVKRCERGADNNVMGIVSTKPSVIGNSIEATRTNPSHYAIVGMMGQVEPMSLPRTVPSTSATLSPRHHQLPATQCSQTVVTPQWASHLSPSPPVRAR